jgi:hypothetical protein
LNDDNLGSQLALASLGSYQLIRIGEHARAYMGFPRFEKATFIPGCVVSPEVPQCQLDQFDHFAQQVSPQLLKIGG